MITFRCDKCDRELSVADELAGTKYPCPDCADINRVPQHERSQTAPIAKPAAPPPPASANASDAPTDRVPDKAAAAGYPPDRGPVARVVKVRRCWFRSRPASFLLAAAIMLSGLAGLIWAHLGAKPWGWTIIFWPMFIIATLILAWWWVDRFSAALVITTKRTTMHTGFLRRSTSEVVHDNIRNLQVDQTFWQRVWRVGKLGISSSGQDGVEIQVNHLPNPDRLHKIIDLYRPL